MQKRPNAPIRSTCVTTERRLVNYWFSQWFAFPPSDSDFTNWKTEAVNHNKIYRIKCICLWTAYRCCEHSSCSQKSVDPSITVNSHYTLRWNQCARPAHLGPMSRKALPPPTRKKRNSKKNNSRRTMPNSAMFWFSKTLRSGFIHFLSVERLMVASTVSENETSKIFDLPSVVNENATQ